MTNLESHDLPFNKKNAFELRCWGRAQLFWLGEIELHEAVDELWKWVDKIGLLEELTIDEIQKIMSEAFRRVRT